MKNYLEIFRDTAVAKWDSPALGDWRGNDWTYSRVAAEMKALENFFKSKGLQKGDRVALCGKNSARWATAFLAIEASGLVAVPILYDFTNDAVSRLCAHSGAKLLFTDAKFSSAFHTVVNLDEDFSFNGMERETVSPSAFLRDVPELDSLAVINYTSGTTGEPKGVMLSYRNLSANICYGLENIPVRDGDASISMLPMAHMFGLAFEFLYPLCGGSHVFFLGKTPGPSTLLAAFAEIKPYILVTVPLVMEKMVRPILKKLPKIPFVQGIICRMAGRKLMAAFGGRVREIPIGGAALDPQVARFLKRARVPFSVGYGMTECGPLVTYSGWKKFRRGTCGAGIGRYDSVRVDSANPRRVAGEVQVKGDNVMLGYWNNPEASRAAFTSDGWLHTGDLGVIGRDGQIALKGRSKCMILSSNGQNIYPEEIEQMLNAQPVVEESLVLSRGGKLIALVSLAQGADAGALEDCLKRVNRALPSYSRLACFEIMNSPFIHTPKHSIKRSAYC